MHKNGYIYKDSIFHKMNPAIKFITTIFFIVMIFLPFGFLYQLVLFGIITSVFFIAKLPPRLYSKIVISIIFMGLFLLLINWISFKSPGLVFDLYNTRSFIVKQNWDHNSHTTIFNIAGSNHYFVQGSIWGAKPIDDINIFTNLGLNVNNHANGFYVIDNIGDDIYKITDTLSKNDTIRFEYSSQVINGQTYYFFYVFQKNFYSLSSFAITYMIFITMKVFLMILIITILTSTTSSIELTSAIEDIMWPLNYLKLPVNQMAMIIALSIRFIPSLLDESNRVLKAQASRGVDFNNGKTSDKFKSLTSLIVPLFSIAFKKAEELSNAMEARGYNPTRSRTRYRIYEVNLIGWIYLGIVAALLGVTLGLAVGYHGNHALIVSTWMYDCIQILG